MAQYLLVAAGYAAFAAALWAGWWAAKAYRVGESTHSVALATLKIEQSTILGQRRCERDHSHETNLTLRLNEDFTFEPGEPDSTTEFSREGYEFVSLGRAPLVNVKVTLRCDFEERDSVTDPPIQHIVDVGSMRSDGCMFGQLWIHRRLLDRITLEWMSLGATCDGPLDFRPLKPYRPTIVAKRPIAPATPSNAVPSAEHLSEFAVRPEVPEAPPQAIQ